MWKPPQRIKYQTAVERWPTAEEAQRSHLYSRLCAPNLDLAQRTWVPAMVPWRATEDGFVTRDLLDWYGRYAEGKPGAIVVEATGSARGFELAVACTRPRGTLVLKSTVAEHPRVDLAPLVIHEIQVVGSRCGPFPPALAALADDSVDVASLIHERVGLGRADLALTRAARPGALKVLVEAD